MFFSKITIKTDIFKSPSLSTIVVHQLKSAYGVHRLLWDLFPDQKKRCFIFREEMESSQGKTRNIPLYYMVSRKRPIENQLFDIEVKPYQPWLCEGAFFHFKLRANPVVARKKDGKKNSVHHDLVMNCKHDTYQILSKKLGIPPVRSNCLKKEILIKDCKEIEEAISQLDGGFVCRDGSGLLLSFIKHRTHKCLYDWLNRKGESAGGFQLSDHLQATGYQRHQIPEKGKNAAFCSMDFEGKLMVTDSDQFEETLYNGIGRSKSFGCGMLMIKR